MFEFRLIFSEINLKMVDYMSLSHEELRVLEEEADHKLDVYKDVAKYGFSCQGSYDVDIPGMCKMQVPYFLHLYVDVDKIRLVDDVAEQQDWVKQLNFVYADVDTSQAAINIVDEWNWDNMASSSGALASVTITIYYPEGSDIMDHGDFVLI